MPECDENIVNIDVFTRLHFSAIFMTLLCKWRPWDLILEGFEVPGLPYRPPGYRKFNPPTHVCYKGDISILGSPHLSNKTNPRQSAAVSCSHPGSKLKGFLLNASHA